MSGFGLFGEAFVLGRFWVAGMIVMLGLLAVVVAVAWFGVPKRVVVPGVPQVAAEGVEREIGSDCGAV